MKNPYGSCVDDPDYHFKAQPDDNYIDFNGPRITCKINQRGLEKMPIKIRKRLMDLLAKAMRGY